MAVAIDGSGPSLKNFERQHDNLQAWCLGCAAKSAGASERNGQRLLRGLAFYVIQGKVAVGGED
jgi:hypothetical protein